MQRVHIVGAHRSGTTLMQDMLVTCFDVDGSRTLEMSIYDEPERDDYRVFVSKQPRDILVIRRILDLDPDLSVIYMVRDPRSVITSVNRTHPGMYFCNLRIWLECDRAARRLSGHPRVLTVRYEDLVSNPDTEQDRIAQAFPFLQRVHSFGEFHLHSSATPDRCDAMNDLRAPSADRVDSWKQHLGRIKSQMLLHPGIEQAMIDRGYEQDARWTAMLNEVDAESFQSRSPDHDYLWHRLDWTWRNWVKLARKTLNVRLRRWRQRRSRPVAAELASSNE